jgi:4-hydroxy-4-methyl-2-oxoglutarate aldolase
VRVEPTEDELVALTVQWKGDRFPGGRPRVPDDVLLRLAGATAEHAWSVLDQEGYPRQFAGQWRETNTGRTIVGRAVTSQFLPHRPDFDAAVVTAGALEGHLEGDRQNSWIIESLVEGDVMVTDIFGKVFEGTVIGDNLGTAVATRTRRGAVIDGGVRDLSGLVQLRDVNFYFRDSDPTPIRHVVLAGINTPVLIGGVTVLPGDVVLGTSVGVTFIPPHLAEEVCSASEATHRRDIFGKLRITQRTYSSAEIDVSPWPDYVDADFAEWSKSNPPIPTQIPANKEIR